MFKEILDGRVVGKNRACFLAWKLKRKICCFLSSSVGSTLLISCCCLRYWMWSKWHSESGGTGTLNLVTLDGSGSSSPSPEHLWQEGGGPWWCLLCRIPRSSGAGSWVHCLAVAKVVSSSDTSLASLGNACFLCFIFLSSGDSVSYCWLTNAFDICWNHPGSIAIACSSKS